MQAESSALAPNALHARWLSRSRDDKPMVSLNPLPSATNATCTLTVESFGKASLPKPSSGSKTCKLLCAAMREPKSTPRMNAVAPRPEGESLSLWCAQAHFVYRAHDAMMSPHHNRRRRREESCASSIQAKQYGDQRH